MDSKTQDPVSYKFYHDILNALNLFTPLDGVFTVKLFIWLYYSKSNDQRRMSAEGKEKRSVCEKEVLISWKSQELVKIVQKRFFAPAQLDLLIDNCANTCLFAIKSLSFK